MNGLHVSRVATFTLASMGLTAAALAAPQSVKCTENESFIVIARDGPDVGSQIIVRKKSDPHAKIKCAFSPQHRTISRQRMETPNMFSLCRANF